MDPRSLEKLKAAAGPVLSRRPLVERAWVVERAEAAVLCLDMPGAEALSLTELAEVSLEVQAAGGPRVATVSAPNGDWADEAALSAFEAARPALVYERTRP